MRSCRSKASPAWLGTTHGRLLLAKLAVLVPILGLAAVNRARILPALSHASDSVRRPVMRRLAAFVGLEAGLALVVLALAAAMTLTTPARHGEYGLALTVPVLARRPARRARDEVARLAGHPARAGRTRALVASFLVRHRRAPVRTAALALVAIGAGVGLPPLVVDAYPTTYRRPLVTYHAASIAAGMTTYRERCVTCHGTAGAGNGTTPRTDLRGPPASRRRAGELFGSSRTASPDAACRISGAISAKPSAGT